MCSIIGAFKLESGAKFNNEFIDLGFESMRHRGPDNEDFVIVDEFLVLGHQRLSIIDLELASNQPMERSNYIISFNGEIYNYLELKKDLISKGFKFSTNSDTEVLLVGFQNFGFDFLRKANGMFVFAVYNKLNNELTIIRDRFGVKPIHYMIESGVLYFSSEITPLINIKKDLLRNDSFYKRYFKDTATDYDSSTFACDVFQIPQGSYLNVFNSSVQIDKWYFGKDFTFDKSIFKSKDATIDFAENLLADSIDLRMRADVPICLTLSGGIDSTTIYTIIKKVLKKDIKIFSFAHANEATNELDKVEKIASVFGDYVCKVESGDFNFENVQEDLDKVEFPIWGISTRAYSDIYKAIKSGGFKVVIEGHGSDEILGGYPYMVNSAFYDYFSKFNFIEAFKILKLSSKTSHDGLGNRIGFFRNTISNIFFFFRNYRDEIYFNDVVSNAFRYKILPIVLRAFDRLSMSESIESRSPFMDYRVVEFFNQMPLEYKVSSIGNKAILREILCKHGMDFIYKDKRKIGFSSDLATFYSDQKNISEAIKIAESFNVKDYLTEKKSSLETLNSGKIEWNKTFDLSKFLLIALFEKKIKFKSE